MELDVARKADHILGTDDRELGLKVSSETFTKEFGRGLESSCDEFMQETSSSYTLADNRSLFSRDIEHWMSGHTSSTENAGVQGSRTPMPTAQRSTSSNPNNVSRTPMVQRSTLARSSSLDGAGVWYVLALVLPLFSINNCYANWRCTPSTVLNTAEVFVTNLSRVFARVRAHIRQLAQDQMARELFATAMDIVLVIYAIGFLVLSMYQASIFE